SPSRRKAGTQSPRLPMWAVRQIRCRRPSRGIDGREREQGGARPPGALTRPAAADPHAPVSSVAQAFATAETWSELAGAGPGIVARPPFSTKSPCDQASAFL